MELKFLRNDYVSDPEADIRHTVFEVEQGFVDEFDEIDNRCIHINALLDGKTVGVCRIFTEEDPKIFFLGRLAVSKDMRKKGIGAALLEEAQKAAKEMGGTQIRLHAQMRAIDFYAKCGYHQEGGIELDQGYPHIWMVKDL